MAIKFPNLTTLIKALTDGAKKINSWLAMLALVLLAAVVILIIAMFITPKDSPIYTWYVPIILGFLLVFVGVFLYDRSQDSKPKEDNELANIEKHIKGHWFEFVHNHDRIAFSVSEISYDQRQMQFLLEGTAYTKDGKKAATWTSSGCAVTNLTIPEFKYFWEGEHFKGEGSDKTFSGIGVIKFPPLKTAPISKAKGWYISGSISDLDFTGRYKIDFVKCSKEEIGKIEKDDAAWLKERYEKWRNSFEND